MAEKREERSPDSHHRWIVLVSCFMAQVMLNSFLYSFGRLIIDVMDTFNATRAQASLIQSLLIGVGRGGGFFWGLIISHLGPKKAGLIAASVASFGLLLSYLAKSLIHVMLCVGVIGGSGAVVITFATSVAVGQHFAGNGNAMALSLLATASGAGAIIHSYFLGWLSDTFGLRGTFLILSGLALHGFAFAWLWGPPLDRTRKQPHANGTNTCEENSYIDDFPNSGGSKCEKDRRKSIVSTVSDIVKNEKEINSSIKSPNILLETNKDGGLVTKMISIPESVLMFAEGYTKIDIKENSNVPETMFEKVKQVLRNRRFILFCFGNIFGMPCMQTLNIFFMDIIVDKGISESDASLMFVFYNIFSVIGRSSPGLIMKLPKMTTFSVPMIACMSAVIALVILNFVHSFSFLMVLTCVLGVAQGMVVSINTVITAKLVGMKRLPEAMGFLFTLVGFASLFAGPISGSLRDITGSYTASLFVAATAALLAFLAFLAGHFYKSPSTVTAERRMSVFYVTQM